MQSRFFKVILEIVSFSAHHLVAPFSHRSSLTVTGLSDYITRRKNQKNLNSQKRYKMLVLVLGYALIVRVRTRGPHSLGLKAKKKV